MNSHFKKPTVALHYVNTDTRKAVIAKVTTSEKTYSREFGYVNDLALPLLVAAARVWIAETLDTLNTKEEDVRITPQASNLLGITERIATEKRRIRAARLEQSIATARKDVTAALANYPNSYVSGYTNVYGSLALCFFV